MLHVGPPSARDNVASFAKAVDDAGYDGIWVFDHVVLQKDQQSKYPYSPDGKLGFPPTMDFLEPLTLLAHIAAITKNVRLGTSVLVLPMRQPVLHAKIMATIDALSGGRFVLGAGVGWWVGFGLGMSVTITGLVPVGGWGLGSSLGGV